MNKIKIKYEDKIVFNGNAILLEAVVDGWPRLDLRLNRRIQPIQLMEWPGDIKEMKYVVQIDDFKPCICNLNMYKNKFDEHEYTFYMWDNAGFFDESKD